MPAGNNDPPSSSSTNPPHQRTTFRPPWVKEGPNPLPVPTAPWTLKNTRRDSNKDDTIINNPLAAVQLRKTSITTKEPSSSSTTSQENGENSKENTFKLPQLRPVPPKEETKPEKEKLPPVKLNSVAERQIREPKKPPPSSTTTTHQQEEEIDRVTPVTRNALVRAESIRRLSQTPAPPPMPPPAPAMPLHPSLENKKPLTDKQLDRIEQLKKCTKVRPDWTAMLKEIESNKKLKHVQCNDRSQPLLPQTKATEHFVFESETPNVHNELLKQIQSGINLKRVKTNDRSKPMLEGLRKFRRQMTIEEQIQKSVSMASMPPEEIDDEVDEMDDIDKVRDDLQSTKQMLALELRNKEAQIRENKRLMARIQNLEAELEKERNQKESNNSNSSSVDEKLINSLKKEAEQARKTAEEVERKHTEMSEQLGNAKFQLEEQRKQNQLLEKRMLEALSGKRTSFSQANNLNSLQNGERNESDDEIIDEDDLSEESDSGEDTEEKRERRAQRELKQIRNKLRNFKNKEDNAKKERVALREILKRHQTAIKEEKKKFKALQKEVDKMAALMKDVDEDEEEEEEKDEDEDVEEEEESSSEESESEESEDDSDSERSQSEAEDAPIEKKKANLSARSERHEKILGALKKGNFLLKTNAERLQDDLNKQKELSANLQEDLDSVLAELG